MKMGDYNRIFRRKLEFGLEIKRILGMFESTVKISATPELSLSLGLTKIIIKLGTSLISIKLSIRA